MPHVLRPRTRSALGVSRASIYRHLGQQTDLANAGTRLIASGHAFHRSSTMAFCDGEVRDTDERLIAKAMGTFKYLKLQRTD